MCAFYLFRLICRIIGVLACITALVGILLQSPICTIIGLAALAFDITLIAIRNRCPFCGKSLRIAPIKGGEYCPYCGSKIE